MTSGTVISALFLSTQAPPERTTQVFLETFEGTESDMTGEALAGRPGTLTPEQEEKLIEFWAATLHVFGVLEEPAAEAHENGTATESVGGDSKKPKKKRLGFLRGKNNRDEVSSKSSSRPATGTADTEDKYGQMKDFDEALATLTPEALRATFWSMVKHDHPDALLLRFLRARKWDVDKALVMMMSTMRWRSTDFRVDDDIMKNGELASLEASQSGEGAAKKLGEDFLAQMRLGKSFLQGHDEAGRPMCFVRVRLHKAGEQSEESLERYTVYVIESARMLLSPPVDTAVSNIEHWMQMTNILTVHCIRHDRILDGQYGESWALRGKA